MAPRRVVPAILALGLAFAAVLALASPCLACSCAPVTPKDAFRGADAAFVGRVVNDVMIETGTTQTFEIDRVFKGNLSSRVDVWTQIGTEMVSSCALLYPVGDRVAVLLVRDGKGHWVAQPCGQVTEAELHRIAGPGSEPAAVPSPAVERTVPVGDLRNDDDAGGLPTWAVILLGAALALLAVGGQIAWAARRDRREAEAAAATDGEPQEVET